MAMLSDAAITGLPSEHEISMLIVFFFKFASTSWLLNIFKIVELTKQDEL